LRYLHFLLYVLHQDYVNHHSDAAFQVKSINFDGVSISEFRKVA